MRIFNVIIVDSLCQFGRKANQSFVINSCLYRYFSSDTSEETENERMDYDVVIVGVFYSFLILIFIGWMLWSVNSNSFKERSNRTQS